MGIPILEFVFNKDQYEPVCGQWDTTNIADCMGRARYKQPLVYLISCTNLSLLRNNHAAAVVDRGIKDSRKGLTHYLLGLKTEKIPVIDGHYENDRQVVRSIRALIEKAAQRKERRLFVIGTHDDIFAAIQCCAKIPPSQSICTSNSSPTGNLPQGQRIGKITLGDIMGLMKTPYELHPSTSEGLTGESQRIKFINLLIIHAAKVDSPVMILGPSGTGKEIVARQIHAISKGEKKPFVAVNCGAISEKLFESELFGYKKGSHSEAQMDKEGLWQFANGGTLFLDEIGDLSLDHQAKILRTLQNKTIRPIGAVKDEPVNARIIAATNRDLVSMKKNGQFREDLFYRLCCFIIRTPALRSILSDIPVIAQKLWKKITNDEQATLPGDVIEELQKYYWPGNVRELKTLLTLMHNLLVFRKTGLTPTPLHVKAAFYMRRQLEGDILLPDEKDQPVFRMAKILNQLNNIMETIHSIKAQFLSPGSITLTGPVIFKEPLHLQLGELDLLCREPSLFGDADTFFAVHQLYGKLIFIVDGMCSEATNKRSFIEKALTKEIDRVLEKISDTMDNLKGQIDAEAAEAYPDDAS